MLSLPVTLPPSVSCAQIQSYLGVEHRIEPIHVDVFTHQLQEEIREGREAWGQGGEDGAAWASLVKVWGGAMLGTAKAKAGLGVHCCLGNGGPLRSEGAIEKTKSTQAGDGGPGEHMVAQDTVGTRERRPQDRAAAQGKGLRLKGAHRGRVEAPQVPICEASQGSSGERRPHLCHLDDIRELGEAGDGDDIMVCPALGPGKRKSHGEGLGKENGNPTLHKVRPEGGGPQRGPEVMMGIRLTRVLTCCAISGKSLPLSGP